MSEYNNFEEMTVGQIVTADFRAAAIFRNAGIDFCCGGDKSLGLACREKNTSETDLLEELNELAKTEPTPGVNYNEWDLGFLADYIVNTHHKFVMKTLPEMVIYTKKIHTAHGMNHPELTEIAILSQKVNEELLQHLKKEEEVLFPAIKEVLKNDSMAAKGVILSEIYRMKSEHEFAGEAMDRINELAGGYIVPEDGCVTYKLTYDLLKRFEDDLHVHVHLENNILYPKALRLCSPEEN